MIKGKVTIPTDVDIIDDTLRLIDLWGADAVRDCDGTKMPPEWDYIGIKKYATYYTTRKDNEWAMKNPEEIQQVYLMTDFFTALESELRIEIMEHFCKEELKPNTIDDIARWWEVIDRTTGEIVEVKDWYYNKVTGEVVISDVKKFHSYTVSFLAFIIWDPVHMYNALTNEWKDEPHQITYDVRQPKTQKYVLNKLENWMKENPEVDVVRYTTFFHQFTLIFDEFGKEKFVDWFGYGASVSPYILEEFEKEVGYRFRPEYIIDMGYQNTTFRVASKEYKDFIKFQQREVAELIKIFVNITHHYGKEVMMFLGDHWIGTEPYGSYFKTLNIDAVVGSVGNGTTLRLISDIPGVKYTEGRFLPYFFPDSFYGGANPVKEAKENWRTARRAILRKPIDRIGYGGYLKLVLDFPEFVKYIEKVCDEFRELYENIGGCKPYTASFKVTVLNSWGKLRSWGTHMVAHALYSKETYSYNGVLESLSGMPFEVQFISFDDIKENKGILKDAGVIINAGDAYTSFSGGVYWDDPEIVEAIREFVYEGGGFIGIGEPSVYEKQGHYFQLYDVLGVDKELTFSLCTDRYNFTEQEHFIAEECHGEINFGEGIKNIFALADTTVIKQNNHNIQLAANEYGSGRGVYIAGFPFDFANARLLSRAIYYAAHKELEMKRWYSENYNVEVNVYKDNNKFCIVNNTAEPQSTVVYEGDGTSFLVNLMESEIKWYAIR